MVGPAGWALPCTVAWLLKPRCQEGGDEPQDWKWLHTGSVSPGLASCSAPSAGFVPLTLVGVGLPSAP